MENRKILVPVETLDAIMDIFCINMACENCWWYRQNQDDITDCNFPKWEDQHEQKI